MEEWEWRTVLGRRFALGQGVVRYFSIMRVYVLRPIGLSSEFQSSPEVYLSR